MSNGPNMCQAYSRWMDKDTYTTLAPSRSSATGKEGRHMEAIRHETLGGKTTCRLLGAQRVGI